MAPIEKSDFRTAFCGLMMGAADIVPGVSGGTVALVLGIYNRLISAISRFDQQALGMLAAKRWAAAAEYIDLRLDLINSNLIFLLMGNRNVGLTYLTNVRNILFYRT